MCGIVGYIGKQQAIPVIVDGLEKLEYRGYDSAGVAVCKNGEVEVTRAVGKLSELKKTLGERLFNDAAHVGIGHTRWATHGRPSENNAHPHTAGRVSLIHNGIIENYIELREELKAGGSVFKSETDTEIGAHLLDHYLAKGLAPFEALKATCSDIRGSYAFVALDSQHPDRLLVAKNSTPIVIGVGEGEMIVASDIPAVLPYTRKIVILEDGDIAEIKADSLFIQNAGEQVEREPMFVSWDPVTAQKGGFKHFMLKEIHEQSQVLAESIRGRIKFEQPEIILPEVTLSDDEIKQIERIVLVACGTAWHACLVAKFYLESLSGIPCEVDYASEFRYRTPLYNEKTLIIAISQSGETADTLAAIDLVSNGSQQTKAKTLAICNVVGSSLTRKVKSVVYTQAGPEISVASTKAFTTQLVGALLLAMYVGQKRGCLPVHKVREITEGLLKLPTAAVQTLEGSPLVEETAKIFHDVKDFLFLGRGLCYPIALEGALKLKEISYIHAEGYPAAEMKHGPIALIDETMPVVVVLQRSNLLFEKTISNLKEVEARGGQIIAVTDVHEHPELKRVAQTVIEVPFLHEYLSPILLTIPLQLLAYYVAEFNGTDVDLPRNLAKSVTVE